MAQSQTILISINVTSVLTNVTETVLTEVSSLLRTEESKNLRRITPQCYQVFVMSGEGVMNDTFYIIGLNSLHHGPAPLQLNVEH